ncbi:MAG: class I SAM-dependent methyltransferase [Pseudomonadota bacterium]
MDIASWNESQKEYYEHTPRQRMIPTNTPYVKRQIAHIVSSAAITPEMKILEVGCGMGRYTIPMWDQGIRVDALDLSDVLLQRLLAYNTNNHPIKTICCDLHQPKPELFSQYDLVIGYFMLHHLADLTKALSETIKFLKIGGRAIFLEPNAYNPLYYLQIAFAAGMTWQGDKGVLQMRKGFVERCFDGAGFNQFKCERFGFFPPCITNQAIGQRAENALEKVKILMYIRPFQLFSAVRHK